MRRDKSNREFVRSLKNKPCTDCGVLYHYAVMEFDHLRDKKFQLNHAGRRSYESILREISKCELVCANCHRMRTFKRSKLIKNELKKLEPDLFY